MQDIEELKRLGLSVRPISRLTACEEAGKQESYATNRPEHRERPSLPVSSKDAADAKAAQQTSGNAGTNPNWQEFTRNLGALVANPFAFSVLLIARSGIARYGSIDPETSLTY